MFQNNVIIQLNTRLKYRKACFDVVVTKEIVVLESDQTTIKEVYFIKLLV